MKAIEDPDSKSAIQTIAQAFGTDKPEGDVNGDGVVNVFDLVLIAN